MKVKNKKKVVESIDECLLFIKQRLNKTVIKKAKEEKKELKKVA